MAPSRIALQLYTIRELAMKDMAEALRAVARIGYRAVELAGFGGLAPPDVKALLEQLDLHALGAHIPYEQWLSDPEAALDDLNVIGCDYAVVPSLPEELWDGAEAISSSAATLNRWGELCRARGLTFAYHNHAAEFEASHGSTTWQALTGSTDPELVKLELDAYWARFAGVDPIELLGVHAGRIPLLHVKDMAGDATRADRPLGDGVMPWAEILEAAEAAGVGSFIVEQDDPQDPLRDSATSLRHLSELGVNGP